MEKVIVTTLLLFIFPTFAAAIENSDDPWEQWNRKIYTFNRTIDAKIASPAAAAYLSITPRVVQQGVRNFFTNLDEVPTMINNLLQGKVKDSASDLGRFLVNSTVGIVGLWDPASLMGLEKNQEDFGQTLGVWGMPSGPYVMLPLLGPSTLRGLVNYADYPDYDLLGIIKHTPTRQMLKGLELVETRAEFTRYDDMLNGSLDEYIFIRDAYLQSRAHRVFDGDISDEYDSCEDETDFSCDF